ncbi:MAG: YheT family hydrolase [Bryobacteraceae bacterium]
MNPDFKPLIRNPHLSTIAGNFWRRTLDEQRYPVTRKLYKIDRQTTIVSLQQQPAAPAQGQIIFLHGLEGSAEAGYIKSFSQTALERGFGVHRLNLRTCGGTEELCETMYHSGLTSDTHTVLETIKQYWRQPIFVVGFSLGGNVVLKLAGELGETQLLNGVCAVSPPIDLAACVRAIDKRSNILYARRFLDRLRKRIERKSRLAPHLYSSDGLHTVKTVWQFDDRYTAPLFGFGNAANYYATQSAANFLDTIRIPTLVITAEDDPLVPFEIFRHPAFRQNAAIQLVATKHGGHLGFLSRDRPRFWIDSFALNWAEKIVAALPANGTIPEPVASTWESPR